MASYAELLKDPRWQRKRLEVLDSAGFQCERCEAADRTLHVHHKQYIKGRKPWEYARDELEALCLDCHGEHHKVEAVWNGLFASAGSYEAEIVALAVGYLDCGFDVMDEAVAKQGKALDPAAYAYGVLLRTIRHESDENILRVCAILREAKFLNPMEESALDAVEREDRSQ